MEITVDIMESGEMIGRDCPQREKKWAEHRLSTGNDPHLGGRKPGGEDNDGGEKVAV